MTSTQSHQLTLSIDNAGVAGTIYVTDDASANDITLKIGATARASFTPAKTVPDRSEAKTSTGSLLYVNLGPLNLTAAEFSAISPPPGEWQLVMFPGKQVIGMSPKADVAISPGEEISVKIGAFAAAHATGASASMVLDVYRVGGITGSGSMDFATNWTVALAAPPHGGAALSADLVVELLSPNVVNTVPGYNEVYNQLCFAFAPADNGKAVYPGPHTVFTLSFVYATDPSGYGALCRPDDVKPPFQVIAGTNAGQWTITSHLAQQSPSWTLVPPQGAPIVGSGAQSTVSILANDLVTSFQPGPTVALISYSGIPDYADGVFILVINKIAHVRINALTATPNPAEAGDDQTAKTTVTWQADDADSLVLAPFQVDVTGQPDYPATLTGTTQITLSATGTGPGNIAIRNITARVRPVINSFVADPRSVYAGDLPRSVDLNWNVNTRDDLQLVSSVTGPDARKYGHIGETPKQIGGPQMLTLRPDGAALDAAAQRSIIISAFKPESRRLGSVPARYIAAPPNAAFVLAGDGETVTAVDTLAYQPVSDDDVPAGKGPAGMVFSADGRTLYVANSGDGTVSRISVGADSGDDSRYVFTAGPAAPVGGSPQDAALSPDGKYLYVSVDDGSGRGRLLVLTTGDSLTVDQTVATGAAPRGIAVMSTGTRIYVANSGSSSVTVVGRSQRGRHAPLAPVTGLPGAEDVALTDDNNVLLVACPKASSVMAVNATHTDARPKMLALSGAPHRIATIPSGAYAVAAGQGGAQGSGAVSLLKVGGTLSECELLDAGVTIASAGVALAVTPDAGLVLVGMGSSGLAAITLAEYQADPAAPKVGGQPTDVAISPDGTTVIAWHNAHKTINHGSPSTGLFSYEIASGAVTQQLASTRVVGMAWHPAASATSAFLIEDGRAAVGIFDSGTWTASGSIDLTGQSAGMPVALAVSADASTLFVVTADGQHQCELVAYHLSDSPPGYAPLGMVPLLTAEAGSAQTLTAAPDGSKAYVTDEGSGLVLIVQRGASGGYGLAKKPVDVGKWASASALSPDGSRLYVISGNENSVLSEVPTATGKLRQVVLPAISETELTGLAVSPDGTRILASDQAATAVRIFDAASLRLVQTISMPGAAMPNGIAAARDGSRIFTANTLSNDLGVIAQVQAGAAGAPVSDPAPYSGIFVRDYLNQTPQNPILPGAELSGSPDLWCSGQKALPNAPVSLPATYHENSPNQIFISGKGEDNYVYLRGINAASGPLAARAWLYYVNWEGDPALILWPQNWTNKGITTATNDNCWTEITSDQPGQVVYTPIPFNWNAVPVNGHYCMIGWVENPPLSNPPQNPALAIGHINSFADLYTFLQTHHNMAWKNTTEVPMTAETWAQDIVVAPPKEMGIFYLGVEFEQVPVPDDPDNAPDTDFCHLAFRAVGPDGTKKTSINYPKAPIKVSSGQQTLRIDWSGYSIENFPSTKLSVQFWAGSLPVPPGVTLTPVIGTSAASLIGLVPDPLAGAERVLAYPADGEGPPRVDHVHFAGSVRLNILPPGK
jgi:DNA-binding beta-propeller fold protein YncE